MLRLIAARASLLLAVFTFLFMDHRLFMPFGLFLALALLAVSAHLHRAFTEPRPLHGTRFSWGVVLALCLGTVMADLVRSSLLALTLRQRVLLFSAFVLSTALYTAADGKKRLARFKGRTG